MDIIANHKKVTPLESELRRGIGQETISGHRRLETNHLGAILTKTNKWYTRSLNRQITRLDRECRRQIIKHDWTQQQFFIHQVFDQQGNLKFSDRNKQAHIARIKRHSSASNITRKAKKISHIKAQSLTILRKGLFTGRRPQHIIRNESVRKLMAEREEKQPSQTPTKMTRFRNEILNKKNVPENTLAFLSKPELSSVTEESSEKNVESLQENIQNLSITSTDNIRKIKQTAADASDTSINITGTYREQHVKNKLPAVNEHKPVQQANTHATQDKFHWAILQQNLKDGAGFASITSVQNSERQHMKKRLTSREKSSKNSPSRDESRRMSIVHAHADKEKVLKETRRNVFVKNREDTPCQDDTLWKIVTQLPTNYMAKAYQSGYALVAQRQRQLIDVNKKRIQDIFRDERWTSLDKALTEEQTKSIKLPALV